MKWRFQCSGPLTSILTKFCTVNHIWTEISHVYFGWSRFTSFGAVRVQFLGFQFEMYIAYNNLSSTTVHACDSPPIHIQTACYFRHYSSKNNFKLRHMNIHRAMPSKTRNNKLLQQICRQKLTKVQTP
jgi:hypothetical protein